jgi:hypothetical protein
LSAHTPGPWSVDRGGAICGAKLYEYARGNNTRQLALACLHDDLDSEERDANAHLIAAAPELLEALDGMVVLMDSLWKSVPWGKTFNLDIQKLNEAPIAARRALGKARGGQ